MLESIEYESQANTFCLSLTLNLENGNDNNEKTIDKTIFLRIDRDFQSYNKAK